MRDRLMQNGLGQQRIVDTDARKICDYRITIPENTIASRTNFANTFIKAMTGLADNTKAEIVVKDDQLHITVTTL